jgi:hypothetical protein
MIIHTKIKKAVSALGALILKPAFCLIILFL